KVDGNYLAGGGFTVYSDGQFDGGAITGVSITNNYLAKGGYGYYYVNYNSPTISGNIEGAWESVPSGSPAPTPVPTPTPGSLSGTSGNDSLVGTANADVINGLAGNDKIDGKGGADEMHGGQGNDVYFVDNVSDRVIENAGEGTDGVNATISHTLTANVENLILRGTAAINGTGNELANKIDGNSASNTLKGLAGNDVLAGHGGKDFLFGGDGADTFQFSTIKDAHGTSIMDFVHGADKIDLRGIDADTSATGNQAFTLLGYTGADPAKGQLTLTESSDGNTHIHGNDGTSVFDLVVKGVHLGITSGDFYL
ncbi:MAG: calcium-binding protein, partial [Geminicoccaceae bacterium]